MLTVGSFEGKLAAFTHFPFEYQSIANFAPLFHSLLQQHYVSFGLIPGFGLFSESYLLFIFNQIAGPFKTYAPWTTCYSGEMDGYTKMASLVGIIVGMLFFGFFADKMGRRVGSIATNVLMLAGAIMLTAASPAPFPDGDNQACHISALSLLSFWLMGPDWRKWSQGEQVNWSAVVIGIAS